jgi:S-adenosylmethionine-diacylglycerol 3-amino-3-carboxypropyl transferase
MSGARFDFLRYAAVWEDADILCDALAPAARGGRILSIASAGDNALALLTTDPEEIVAVDLSGPQLAACELRVAAWRLLEREELLGFLGVRPHANRLHVYSLLRAELTTNARGYWDRHDDAVRDGMVHSGKFERYLRSFRRYMLPLVHSRRTIDRLLAERPPEERVRFYEEEWDTARWRLVFRIFFSRFVMGRMGRDPQFFAHVEGTVGDRILARTRHALTELPLHRNPYIAYIMTGSYTDEAMPLYLRQEAWLPIRERLGRLRLFQAPAQAATGHFDAYNLSDIFEYMSPSMHEATYAALLEKARPGARLAYWNMLAPRSRPAGFAARVESRRELADPLFQRDNAWFYSAFHVDEVKALNARPG